MFASLVTALTLGVAPVSPDSLAVVSGSVYEIMQIGETNKQVPVSNAFVVVSAGRDSVRTLTNQFGQFTVSGTRPGRTQIRVSKMGYRQEIMKADCGPGQNLFVLELKEATVRLASSVVVAETPPVTHRGDTVLFHAAAVSLREEDNAVEILSQMPGVTFQNGIIYVNGEEIKRTYVNGRLIFGDKPLSPLTSILAADVVHIKAYDELSRSARLAGALQGEREKVLDITTREPIVTAFDGHVLATGGVDARKDGQETLQGRYGGGLVANFFSEQFLAYLTLNANNLNKTTVRQDEFTRSDGSLTRYEEYTEVAAGVEKYWGDRLLGSNVKGSYRFVSDYGRSGSHSWEHYYETDLSPARTYADTLRSGLQNGTHEIKLSSEIHHPVLKSLVTGLEVSVGNNRSNATDIRRTDWADGTRRQYLLDDSHGRNFDIGAFMSWSDHTRSDGFSPLVSLSFGLRNGDGSESRKDTLKTSDVYQNLSWLRMERDRNFLASGGFSKMLVNSEEKTMTLMATFQVAHAAHAQVRDAWDISPVGIRTANDNQTVDYNWAEWTLSPVITFGVSRPQSMFSVMLHPSFVHKRDDERRPVPYLAQKWFFAPFATLNFHHNLLRLTLNLTSETPAVAQFRDWLDDRNPLFLTRGNPALVSSSNGRFTVQYTFPKAGKYASLELMGAVNATLHPIVSQTSFFAVSEILPDGYIVPAGAMLTGYANADVSFDGMLQASWNKRFQKLKATLRADAFFSAGSSQVYDGDELVRMDMLHPGLRWSFTWNPKWSVRAGLTHSLDYTYASSRKMVEPVSSRLSSALGVNGSFTFLKKCFCNLSYRWNTTRFFAATGRSQDFHILDAVLGVRLLNGRLGISVSCNDALNAGGAVSLQNTALMRSQTWRPSYGRYYLLNVSFRLNKKNPGREYQGFLQEGGERLPRMTR